MTSQNGDAVSVVDLERAEIVARADISGAPAPVAYDPAERRAYVISADTGRLHVLDEEARVVARADLGAGAFGLASAPGGGIFVADWYGGMLTRLDAELRPVWQSRTSDAPAGVAVSRDGSLVATADRDADAVSIFAADDGQRLHQVPTAGSHPFGITFHDGLIYTADVQGDTVSVIDPQAGKLLGQVPTGSHPYAVAFAGGKGFVTNQYDSSVTVFDPATLNVVAEVDVGDYPEGIAPLPDGSGVAVANWDSDSLVILDALDLSIRDSIDMPSGPRAFGSFTGRQVLP
ncbi:YncE family protein [Paracoccus beibuensis]|uniref:YncE family protein n=1 Tax=Paracoccus beibuensis TaxID=547602 RepID=UPI0022401425|nr:YncE family protein [Paracoccus beibuensis]